MTNKSQKIVSKTEKLCVKGTFPYPLVIKDGKGCYLQDIDGKWYLDFNANVSSCNVGYKHPEIMKVLARYSKIGAHKIAGQDFYTEEQIDLAEKLLEIIPKKLKKIFFTNSGAEAVENAIKFAFRKKGPLPGIACTGAFHGRTLGALSLTNSKAVQKKNYPEINHELIKFCTSDSDQNINGLEELIQRESTPAFMIVECIQGEGGYNVASKKFIKNLRKVSHDYDFPLIVDEIQSGMGRTGKWWSFQHYDIEPDIMACAKSLQVGATVSSDQYAPNEVGAVSSTWAGGHRIDLVIGLKTIEIIEKEKLLRNAELMGKYMMKRLNGLMEKYPEKVVDVRGIGLMIGMELAAEQHKDLLGVGCFKDGLVLLGCGVKTIRFSPPLIIKKEEIDKGVEIVEENLKKLR